MPWEIEGRGRLCDEKVDLYWHFVDNATGAKKKFNSFVKASGHWQIFVCFCIPIFFWNGRVVNLVVL